MIVAAVISLDQGEEEVAPKHKKQHRLATYWFIVMLDQILRHFCEQGLEAFATKGQWML